MTRTPIMRLAVHLESANEMRDPPKPKMAANTSKPPVPPPWNNCTPNTFSTTNSTRLSSASTARLVRTDRKMRCMGLRIGKKSRNMLTRQLHGRDVEVQFQVRVFRGGSPYGQRSVMFL